MRVRIGISRTCAHLLFLKLWISLVLEKRKRKENGWLWGMDCIKSFRINVYFTFSSSLYLMFLCRNETMGLSDSYVVFLHNQNWDKE